MTAGDDPANDRPVEGSGVENVPADDGVTGSTPVAAPPGGTPPPTPQGDGTPGPAPATSPAGQPAGRPPSHVQVVWQGEHRFDVGRPGGTASRVDASAATGPSPVDMLLGALASCISVDVVDILAKRRTPVSSLQVEVVGERANAVPARVTRAELVFRIEGEGVERVHAERAIELAITRYCSVRESLDPDMPVSWTLELNGAG